MIGPGVYPASITPMRPHGQIDLPSFVRLLTHFETSGCAGVVLAGTNGEGPSLSAMEKRDLVRELRPLVPNFPLILGIATPSVEEAIWSSRQGARLGAQATLLMAPAYFREATEAGIEAWFRAVLDQGKCPTIVYNFPQRTGITLTPALVARLANHPNFVGLKDSSGDHANLAAYRAALPGKALFVGDETLLLDALGAGWTGTISGAANVVPRWLSQVVAEHPSESAVTKFELVVPAIRFIRSCPQPVTNKAMVQRLGLIEHSAPRLPLLASADGVGDGWKIVEPFARA